MAHRENVHSYKDGECRLWAKTVQGHLPFATQRISWTATGIDPFAKSARHEVLAYRVGREIWFIDNLSAGPRWVGNEGERVEVMAMQFYAPAFVLISGIAVE